MESGRAARNSAISVHQVLVYGSSIYARNVPRMQVTQKSAWSALDGLSRCLKARGFLPPHTRSIAKHFTTAEQQQEQYPAHTSKMMNTRRSSIVPYKAVLTEKNLADQSNKVFIVTGGTGGLGKELITILYQHNAKVYVTARSEGKSKELIAELKKTYPKSTGDLIFLKLQLDDLTTIKSSAEEFLSKETRLDVLWNNAGVMVPPQGSKTIQGYELQLGINNLGHFLFSRFLTPVLKATAKSAPKDSVRVVWVSSSAADAAPKPAIDFDNMDYKREEGIWSKYARSKAGNVLHSVEFSRRTAGSGIVSLVSCTYLVEVSRAMH